MFQGLRNEIIRLNSDVKNVANSEKAKKLRKMPSEFSRVFGSI